MARARSRAPSERQYPTVYIAWKLLYILATSFCKLVAGQGGVRPPQQTPPAPAAPPLADLDLDLVVFQLALGGVSPWLSAGPSCPLPVGPAPLVDETVLHCGTGSGQRPRPAGPWTNPSHALCSYLCGARAGTRGRGCWPWCWEGCLASRSTCRRFCYRPALQRWGGGSSVPGRPPSLLSKAPEPLSSAPGHKALTSLPPQDHSAPSRQPRLSSCLGPATPAGPPPVCSLSQTHPGPPFPVTFLQHLPL